jgi:NMD protein affecting ribosome stability and mRNA decay
MVSQVKLTIQKEVLNGTILQQTFVAEYVVDWHMCDACSKMAANSDQWVACCQVRHNLWTTRMCFEPKRRLRPGVGPSNPE